MRVLALGGCGQQGSRAVTTLLHADDVEAVVVADIDFIRARDFVARVDDPRLRALQVDVSCPAELRAAMEGMDVVGNFVGPFFRFAEGVVAAAIDAGVNYVDICDDTAPTIRLLDEYHLAASKANVCILLGMGASPGMLNLFARAGTDRLDEVEDIRIYWNVSVNDIDTDIAYNSNNAAIFEHCIEILAGDVVQFIDGQSRIVEPGSGLTEVDFPHLGRQRVYYVSHPEPATLPRYITARNITNQGGVLGMDDLLFGLRDLGLASHDSITVKGATLRASDVAIEIMARLAAKAEPVPEAIAPVCSDSMVFVTGRLDGHPATIRFTHESARGLPRMDEGTGISAAAGILMMGRGQITSHGVFAPEGCVDPLIFFDLLAGEGITVRQVISSS